MNKREIFERLWDIANGLSFARGEISSNADVYKAIDYATNAVDFARNSICDLFLDVAAPIPPKTFPTLDVPATEEERPKAEEKHPGVVPVNEKYLATCLKCGGDVQMLHEDGVYYCPKCNAAFCAPKGELKREEGEK